MAMFTGTSGRRQESGSSDPARGDIFPAMLLYPSAGMLIGLVAMFITASVLGRSGGEMAASTRLVCALGAILGMFVGLGRGVWRPASSAPALEIRPDADAHPAPSPLLWDEWVDEGRDPVPAPEPQSAEGESALAPPDEPRPARAVVRPRVIAPATGEALRLEDEIGPILLKKRGGLVVIAGGAGSGKTTALEYLDGILPPWSRERVRMLETFDASAIASAGPDPLLIVTLPRLRATSLDQLKIQLASAETLEPLERLVALTPDREISFFPLAPWGFDDAIEYLLAAGREVCGSVIGRLRQSNDFDFLDGIPELCTLVLDRMRRDAMIRDARTALRAELNRYVAEFPSYRRRLQEYGLDVILRGSGASQVPPIDILRELGALADRVGRLIRHRPVAVLLAADRIVEIIASGFPERELNGCHSRELIEEVARRLAQNPEALDHLVGWLHGKRPSVQPLAASLLHAVNPAWRPDPGCRPKLAGAYLAGVEWPRQDLAHCNLQHAELSDANLRRAILAHANATGGNLRAANLAGADLSHLVGKGINLGRADLSGARAAHALLHRADLSEATLVNANLWKADLTAARIEGADFRGAVLEDACLQELPLRLARFEGARFGGANLVGCDLEGIELPGADFHDAQLAGATLTGSRMSGSVFLGADLQKARMADIDWPGACLRDADLRGVIFHLGTTRSGMLDSPIACEGSRTGFYTTDPLDREIQPAELIRTANLRGADLRGATIEGVDFYLVDLRDALYTEDQAEHLRRCRAILEDPSE